MFFLTKNKQNDKNEILINIKDHNKTSKTISKCNFWKYKKKKFKT